MVRSGRNRESRQPSSKKKKIEESEDSDISLDDTPVEKASPEKKKEKGKDKNKERDKDKVKEKEKDKLEDKEKEKDKLEDKANESQDHTFDDEEGGIKFDDIYIPPPPPAAFQAHADGSRLIITHIVNENFKSYADVQELGPFHKYFTAIIGPNGSGKSNVIDSMLFVFGYRASRLRSKKISALLHDSPNHGKVTSCTVTVHFALMIDVPDDVDAYQLKPGSEFYISRTACSDNSSYYTINGRKSQFKEVSPGYSVKI